MSTSENQEFTEQFERLSRNLAAQDMAQINMAYFQAHIVAGFTEDQAMEILKKFIETRLVLAHTEIEEDESGESED